MDLKTSTPAVRTSYLKVMITMFNANTIKDAVPLVPTLLKALDKAAAQPAQIPLVMEGLFAAYLLLKIASFEGEKENNYQNLWNVVLDMDKQLFISEKFLSMASDDGKYIFNKLVNVCEE